MNAKKILFFLAILCLPVIGLAQNTLSENDLIGQWKFDYTTSFSNLTSESQQRLDTATIDYKQRIETAYKDRVIVFEQGGTYKQIQSNGMELTGTWELLSQTNEVVITSPFGGKLIQTVHTLSSSKLLLVPVMNENSRMLVSKWYFTKL